MARKSRSIPGSPDKDFNSPNISSNVIGNNNTVNRISINSLNNSSPTSSSTPNTTNITLVSIPPTSPTEKDNNNDQIHKIQHQFKSIEKLTLLQQVILFNPYQNKKDGWSQVKNGYLSWKNIHRPKYADPAEDYIKRKVQEILRLYSRSGKESLKDNGFNDFDTPEALLFLSLIEQVIAMKNNDLETLAKLAAKTKNIDLINAVNKTISKAEESTNEVGNQANDDYLQNPKRRKISGPITSSSSSPTQSNYINTPVRYATPNHHYQYNNKDTPILNPMPVNPTTFQHHFQSHPHSQNPQHSQQVPQVSQPHQIPQQVPQHHQVPPQHQQIPQPIPQQHQIPQHQVPPQPQQHQHQQVPPQPPQSPRNFNLQGFFNNYQFSTTTIGELPIMEFVVLMNRINQDFASIFAKEFTKQLSETLCITISKAIKEAVEETSKSNLEIIKALKG